MKFGFMNMQVALYTPNDAPVWDTLVNSSWNGTFLHTRRFLSYHRNRFQDKSLLILDEKGRLAGVLPAAESLTVPDIVVSHPGITYGGLIHAGRLIGGKSIFAFEEITTFYRTMGYAKLVYKAVPFIYHRVLVQDDLYALFRKKAVLSRSDLAAIVDLSQPSRLSELRRRGYFKAQRANLTLKAGKECFPKFWDILEERLSKKFGKKPVHSLEEILELHSLFPQQIQCLTLNKGGETIAGTVLFRSHKTVHAQYIAASELGYKFNALDLLFSTCIEQAKAEGFTYFSFGISTENDGWQLNEGLYNFKMGFGSGSITHNFYEISLDS